MKEVRPKPPPAQAEPDFDELYKDAAIAREHLKSFVANEWVQYDKVGSTVLCRPVPGTQKDWVDTAIDPGTHIL